MDLCLACCCSWCFQPIPKIKRWTWCRVSPQADLQIWSLPWLAFINGGFERVDWCTSSHTCNLPCKESCLPIVHGFTHTMGHCRSYRHNAKISKFCSGLAASDSLRLKHFFCHHMLAQTNNQTCKEASYILVFFKKNTVNDPTTQRISRLAPSEPGLWDPEFSLQKQRSWWNSIGPGRSFQHFATSSNWWLDPHPPRCDETTSHLAHKNGENPSRSSRKGTVPVIPLRLRTWMKTWLTCLTQLEDIIHIIPGYL